MTDDLLERAEQTARRWDQKSCQRDGCPGCAALRATAALLRELVSEVERLRKAVGEEL